MENGTPLIRLEAIKKVFFTEEMETHALEDIHLDIHDGEFAEVMGPSGCGKSTLLNIVGLLDNPSDGDYFFFDENVAPYNEARRSQIRKQNIGFIFQSFNLIDELTVAENIDPIEKKPLYHFHPGW